MTEAAETSRKILKLAERIPENFSCKDGCAECCKTRITVHKAEWTEVLQPLAERLLSDSDQLVVISSGEPREANLLQIVDASTGHCPFLKDGRDCLIYDHRPFVCRQYGQFWGMRCQEGVDFDPASEVDEDVVVGFSMLLVAGTPYEGGPMLSAEQRAEQRRKIEAWRSKYRRKGDTVPQTAEELTQFRSIR